MADRDAELESQLKQLLARGDKVAAIKLLREARGLELAVAKVEVERLEAGGTLPAAPPSVAEVVPEDVRALAAKGDKVAAIRVLRERQGLELAEAKRRIESVSAGATKSGCAGGLALLVLVGAVLWGAAQWIGA